MVCVVRWCVVVACVVWKWVWCGVVMLWCLCVLCGGACDVRGGVLAWCVVCICEVNVPSQAPQGHRRASSNRS